MNRFRVCSTVVIIAVALLFASVASAQAQIVAFSQVRDAAPGKFFDAATSEPFAANANRLNIGLNTGSDPATFVSNAFRVTTLSFGNRMANDTISFVVTAPADFYVASLTYSQQGTANSGRTAVQTGNTQWTVAGTPAVIGEYTGPPIVAGTINLDALQLGSVAVSITVSMFAGSTGDMEITSANVVAEIKPVPVVGRDGTAGGGVLQNGPDAGTVVPEPPPVVTPDGRDLGRGPDEGEAGRGRGEDESRRGPGGRDSGRNSGRR
jgi:hypothetical protein